jgi:heme oxygenase
VLTASHVRTLACVWSHREIVIRPERCNTSRMRQVGMIGHLEVETCAYHAAADMFWLDLVHDANTTEAHYLQRLVRAYGFAAPLEAALAYTPGLQELVDVGRHFRSGLIASDLIRLGLTPKQVAEIDQCMLAPFASVPEALGWLYVHERTTSVHTKVREVLIARMPGLEGATSFLAAPNEARRVRLAQLLDRLTRGSGEDRVVRAALDAFHACLKWLQRGVTEVHHPDAARRSSPGLR